MKESKPLVNFEKVNISNGDNLVITDFSIVVNKGEFVYLTGRVGTGKTSIIRTMIGENPVEGDVASILDFNLLRLKQKQIPYLRRKIGVVFQDFQLLMDRSVESNLEFVLLATDWSSKKEIRSRIDQVLSDVGMSTKAHKMPHQLSGGEQQRIAIARALLNEPDLILADEPTGNLDAQTADGIMQLLVDINRNAGTAIVIVTHNQSLLERYKGRVFVCQDQLCNEIIQDD